MNEPLPTLHLLRDQVFGHYAAVPVAEVAMWRGLIDGIEARYGLDPEGAERLRRPGMETFVFGNDAEDLALLRRSGLVNEIPTEYTLDEQSYRPPVASLLDLPADDYSDDDPCDYAALGLTHEHLPELERMASNSEWNHSNGGAPLHAVRAITALGGAEVPGVLLRLLQQASTTELGDWLCEEVKSWLFRGGPESVVPLAEFVADENVEKWARVGAVEAMQRVAREHPECRERCVERLIALLAQYAVQAPELNGFLVAALVELGAKEAAPLMERAFAAGRVDETINGDWEDAQIELGLKLRRERAPKPTALSELGRRFRAELGVPEPFMDEFGNRSAPLADPLAMFAPSESAPAKVGRNDPCPCGSGKKFKKCCGA